MFVRRLGLLVGCAAFAVAGVASQAAAPAKKPAAAKKPAGKTPAGKSPTVVLETSMGTIQIELNEAKAPVTVQNFVRYVKKGQYNGTVFHRVIPGFMIQGGGFTPDMHEKPTDDPITNEGRNGLKNVRGTVAMARTADPNSATAQFFINVSDNASLDYPQPDGYGYAVFGKVTKGMDVADKIVAVPTGVKNGMKDVPTKPVVIKSARVL